MRPSSGLMCVQDPAACVQHGQDSSRSAVSYVGESVKSGGKYVEESVEGRGNMLEKVWSSVG
jgi:hypothetical protein